ncbi:hypothetical protein EC2719100_0453 [Escherichia coli 2719100]|uniref:Uncharacterized protein n=1 Tax=Escherichia coli TaxID=562 RepID=A0A7I9A6K4_ECOLX|nr:hypothetical protein ECP03018671_0417 [Escherichia coli P0301867.1]EMX91386.1 hypothetical protein EC2719100_0453 [Escherichia coli 2719100]ENA29465.1 hypothetical protein ECP03018674_4860 [Escherichia coli P0301867.4]ENA43727.1 hypothetical protein ECP03018672_3379 [Escherichia coli P0301867.2]ENA72188.1 hypothetical protein EC178900_4923 [Escherichia coli 178900]ENC87672.1 hypothetical protein ECP030186711_4931 [Escherichia coli P0301867.11]END18141.1 hypothetical protein ECP03018678_523
MNQLQEIIQILSTGDEDTTDVTGSFKPSGLFPPALQK